MAKKRQTKPKAAKSPRKCDSYEEVARYLLDQFAEEFGLDRVEGKQSVEGKRSGVAWTIDAKGVTISDGGFFIVECRRYTTSKSKQEHLGALAYRIIDTEAFGGIYVSPLGIQEGAQNVAKAEGIFNVTLTENSTPDSFVIGFLGRFRAGRSFTIFTHGAAAPEFPPKGGGFFICGAEPDTSSSDDGKPESHEAS